MRFSLGFSLVAFMIALASARTITVNVGDKGLAFNPPSVNAAVGDVINFQFFPKNHTVTQSTFAAPCQALAGGRDSGYLPVTADAAEIPVWSVTVNNASAPLWFYCAQGTHCSGGGMVFAVNPTAEKSFEKFQATATGKTVSESASAGSASAAVPTPSASAAGGLGTNDNGSRSKGINGSSLLTIAGVLMGVFLM